MMLLVDDVVAPDGEFCSGRISVGGLTDNSGNRFAVAKMLTTKWPLLAFLAELALQLESREILLEVDWVPREQNTEADAITNGDFAWLNPSRRVQTDLKSLPFIMLPDLLARGESFYEGIENVNGGAPNVGVVDKRTLRVREAWD